MPLDLQKLHDQLKYGIPYYSDQELNDHLIQILAELIKRSRQCHEVDY